MLKRLGRTTAVQNLLAFLAVAYLGLVRRTNRLVAEPPDFPARVQPELPVIGAMWHGQHFVAHFAWPRGARIAALISRNRDAELNAGLLRRMGVIPIRGSGGRASKMRKRGGVVALREMLRELARGATIMMTADIPKISRVAGEGIITLAQLSGRPICPIAVVTSRRIDVDSWDHASIPLPFGRCAMVLGAPIHVPREADAATLEALRRQLEDALDATHVRAYGLIGAKDPGRPARERPVRANPFTRDWLKESGR